MKDDLVTVASFSTALEARMAMGRLESMGIPVFIADENTVTMDWMYSNAVGGVKVRVLEEDLDRARAALEEAVPGGARAEEVDRAACPGCGSRDVGYYTDKRGAFLTWIFLGFPILPVRSKLKCAACGHKWKPRKVSG